MKIAVAWGIPTAVASALLLTNHINTSPQEKRNPSFQYGNAQAAIAVFLLVMCFIVTVGCLVIHQRYKKRIEKFMTLSKELSGSESSNTHGSLLFNNLFLLKYIF